MLPLLGVFQALAASIGELHALPLPAKIGAAEEGGAPAPPPQLPARLAHWAASATAAGRGLAQQGGRRALLVAACEPARLEAEEVPWLLDNVLAPLGGAVVFSHGDLNVSPVPLAR